MIDVAGGMTEMTVAITLVRIGKDWIMMTVAVEDTSEAQEVGVEVRCRRERG